MSKNTALRAKSPTKAVSTDGGFSSLSNTATLRRSTQNLNTSGKEASGGTAGGSSGTPRVIRGRSEIEQEFDKLRSLDRLDEGVDAIGPKALQHLAGELAIQMLDLDFYIFAWKMGGSQSFCITRSEWMHAVYINKIEHVGMLKASLANWRHATLADRAQFTDFYHSVFDFLRADDEKLLPLEKALKAWQVLLPENDRFSMLSLWAQWVSTEYKRPITRDIWRELWEFAQKIDDIDHYDPNDKWPTAFDDFVEWVSDKQQRKQAGAPASP